jgi:hypothetical protein
MLFQNCVGVAATVVVVVDLIYLFVLAFVSFEYFKIHLFPHREMLLTSISIQREREEIRIEKVCNNCFL